MEKRIIGYTRVSTQEQNDARQVYDLLNFGIDKRDIFSDKASGKDFERPEYQRMRKKIKDNDVLVIKSLDRLGRDYKEIQQEWLFLTKEKRADIIVLDMPILNTTQNKDLIGTLISDIVLQLLSYVAQTERESIRQRQMEGIAIAKAQGKHLGRPRGGYPKNFKKYFLLYKDRRINRADAALKLGISRDSFRWFCTRFEADQEKAKRTEE